MTDGGLTHALSFDIEDWFHLIEIDAVRDSAKWSGLDSIVRPRTQQILAILREFHTRATFFILGWVAEKYPELVRMIADGGHEIGSHSFWHRKVYEMDPEALRTDLRDSIEVLEQHSGVKVYGFRAPSFSIVPGAEWAFDVLADLGLEYDASLFPAPRGHGGYACPPGPHRVRLTNGATLLELPASVLRFGFMRVCYSGGGYFRLLPLPIIEHGIRQAAREGRPTVVYLHPRDFATDCPVVSMPVYRRFKCYVGLATTECKLRALLSRYRFDTCRSVLSAGRQEGGSAA